jgi:subtilase family serine protease
LENPENVAWFGKAMINRLTGAIYGHWRPLPPVSFVWLTAFGLALGAAAAERQQLNGGHVPAAVARLAPVGRLPASQRLNLAIGLPLRNQGELDSLLQQLYDPASPNYRRYLTPAQFTEQFGPAEKDYQALMDFAKANGLTVTVTHLNRVVLDVAGATTDLERTFHVTLRVYPHPTEARTFYAPDVEPSVDFAVPILHISGLDNYALPHPNLVRRPASASAKAAPNGGSGPSGNYQGSDFRTAYVPGTTLTGAGQSVGLLEFDGFYATDITSYESQAGLPNVPLTVVPIDGGISTPGSGVDEVSLDIEMAISMAPDLSQVYIYEAPNGSPWADILNPMANATNSLGQPFFNQLSCSWSGGTADPTAWQIFNQMNSQGQSFFIASGDSDAYTGAIPFPVDSTNITAVGGTTLTTGSGAAYSSETVWNWGKEEGSYVGSSGGISASYAIPSYQQGLSTNLNQGSPTMRNVPDVALTADNVWVIYGDGQSGEFGGTSCAAPLWAAFTALVNQQALATGHTNVGFLNPALYTIGKSASYTSDFHDITTGNNTNRSSGNKFFAVTGYDLCTGWGTPNGTNLINALVGSAAGSEALIVSPVSGAAVGAAGGPFTVTSGEFLLTNASSSPLTWSLVNTSAWLKVSATNGTLAAAVQTTLACSLTAAASNLAVGNYTATLTFSNWTSQVAQAGLFTLQVNQPLVLSPTNGFTASGPVGGPFSVTSQNYSLTNQGGNSLPWSVVNPSSWLNASPSGGTLAGSAQTAMTVSLAAAANSLAAGIYTANVLVTNPTGVAVSLPFAIEVGQPIVTNGGFETGSFSGWTLNVSSADSENDFVTKSSAWVHSGSYGAELGPLSLGYLYQTLATSPGQNYLLSLWVDNPSGQSGATPNQFLVQWNGATLFNQTDMPFTAWTNLQFIVTATGASTVLQFGFEDTPSYLGLDDISVTPISPPAFKTAQKAAGAFNLTWSAVTGLVYQVQYKTNLLQTNWTNLGASLVAANGTLTLSDTNAVSSASCRFYRVIELP